MKLFSEMAGVIGAKSTGPVQASERFKITINLGGDDTLQREATPSTTKPVITLDHTTPNG
jgi:hypothetical protein